MYAFDHHEDVLASLPKPKPTMPPSLQPSPQASASQGPLDPEREATWSAHTPDGRVLTDKIHVRAIYAARGNPSKWLAWTKANHRREMQAGTWISRIPGAAPADVPADDAPAANNSIQGARTVPSPITSTSSDSQHHLNKRSSWSSRGPGGGISCAEEAEQFWANRETVGLLHDVHQDGSARVRFYEKPQLPDKHSPPEMEAAPDLRELQEIPAAELQKHDLLNTHLGKAGGLNFGLQAVVYTLNAEAAFKARPHDKFPSRTRPLFFGIIDARHTSSEQFWQKVMPCFFVPPARLELALSCSRVHKPLVRRL
jgi:hypothetical protein